MARANSLVRLLRARLCGTRVATAAIAVDAQAQTDTVLTEERRAAVEAMSPANLPNHTMRAVRHVQHWLAACATVISPLLRLNDARPDRYAPHLPGAPARSTDFSLKAVRVAVAYAIAP